MELLFMCILLLGSLEISHFKPIRKIQNNSTVHDYDDLNNYEYSDYDTTLDSDYREPIIILENNVQEIVSCSSEKPAITTDGKSLNFKSPDGEYVNVKISLTDKSLKPNVFITFDNDESRSTVTSGIPDHTNQDFRSKRGYNNTQLDDTYNEISRKNSQKGVLNSASKKESSLSKDESSTGQVSSESHKTESDGSTDDTDNNNEGQSVVVSSHQYTGKHVDEERNLESVSGLSTKYDDIMTSVGKSDELSPEIDSITSNASTVTNKENLDVTHNDTSSETDRIFSNITIAENEKDEHLGIPSKSTLSELDSAVSNHNTDDIENKHIENSDVLDKNSSFAFNGTIISATEQNKIEDTGNIGDDAGHQQNEDFDNTSGADIPNENSYVSNKNISSAEMETISVREQNNTEDTSNINSAEFEQNESVDDTNDNISTENDSINSKDSTDPDNEDTSFESNRAPSNESSSIEENDQKENLDTSSKIASSELDDAVSNDSTSANENEQTENSSSTEIDDNSSNESTISTDQERDENSDTSDKYTSSDIDDVAPNGSTSITENEQIFDNNKSSEPDDDLSNESTVSTEQENDKNSDIPDHYISSEEDYITSYRTNITENEQMSENNKSSELENENEQILYNNASSNVDNSAKNQSTLVIENKYNENSDISDDSTSSEVNGTSLNENTRVTAILREEPVSETSDTDNQRNHTKNYGSLEENGEDENNTSLEVVETKLSNGNDDVINLNESSREHNDHESNQSATDFLQDATDENIQGEAVKEDSRQEDNENSDDRGAATTFVGA